MRRRIRIWGLVFLLFGAGGCATIRPPAGRRPLERVLLTTGYCPCRKCCAWDRNWLGRPVYASGPLRGRRKAVGVTANGAQAREGTLAADTLRYPFGTIMYIPGYGHGRVEDRGGAIKGDHVDLFFETHEEALRWGRQYQRVRIWPP